jgi:hypothetical protein
MSTLIPEYLSTDFNSFIASIKEQLQDSTVFRDYDYEGSNIAIIIELLAYIAEMTTYFTNKIAKNVYFETADQYENIHRLSKLVGYDPKGPRSAQTELSVTIASSASEGDLLTIPRWHQISITDNDDNTLKFATTESSVVTAGEIPYTFTEEVRQGEVVILDSYTSTDIIDNEIILPLEDFAFDDDLDDGNVVIQLEVNGVPWTRLSDFYDEISGLSDVSTVYKFELDKYHRYKVVFLSTRGVPGVGDDIDITVLKTVGAAGSVGANMPTITPDDGFLTNMTTSKVIDDDLTIVNAQSTAAADAETIDEIRESALGTLHSQYRNVTSIDYNAYLEKRSDITASNVWGEAEVAPSGDYSEYNKVHISLIPSNWSTSTVNTSASLTTGYITPIEYSTTWKTTLSAYLEPRKMIGTYEQFDLAELVYFKFDLGIRIKRSYVYASVMEDMRSKLEYYFTNGDRSFNESISFMDIHEYLLDTTKTSSTNDFSSIAGVRNLNIRDIELSEVINDSTSSSYPRYTIAPYTGDNNLREIELGFNQYPMIDIDNSTFTQET